MEHVPEELTAALRTALQELEAYLVSRTDDADISAWLQPFFALSSFLKIAEVYDGTYRTLIDRETQRVSLFCLDPSLRLAKTIKGLRSAIFFSATLSPLAYFVELLGGGPTDKTEVYASPFAPEQMRISIAPFDVSYQGREQSLPGVAKAIQAHLLATPGNHLVFCPSFSYMERLHDKLRELGVSGHLQGSGMTEIQRSEFLERFTKGSDSVALAVLGGIFSEGIDLPGEQLVAITVVGVGLPGLSLERDLLLAYFDAQEKGGYDYAYRLPGMQRVRQAVGRLIRTETDQGAVLLIDKRFRERRYLSLFPQGWRVENDQPPRA